ncbi:membrane protein FxsA [Aquibacillus koreensis]|uniref:Membrane protein FxsA n=1 Tax=Aquibacillus koreensis TaxID=279446 RepID=A0A9X3WG68_9BACI|nr:FxsA family protein [Aquibacillus koreensis]MCT2537181.1 membrane protein FxsA [Aquibacillus koreensis]MDC3419247.1 membrane protein FxsA [Aquibacillus koreensis]
MFRWMLLFILIVPALEIGILVWAGGIIGPWWVVLLIVLTGVIGAWLAKKQGLDTINRARQSMSYGQLPHGEIFDGICILLGAAVLLTPGFITDAMGFLLLLPVTRDPIKRGMQKALRTMMERGTITFYRR